MATLSEKHPREAKIAKELVKDYRDGEWGIWISKKHADELEMKICEALVDAQYTSSRAFFGIAVKGGDII